MPILAGAIFTKAIGYILNRTGGQILNRNSQPIVTRGSATGGGGGGGGTDTGATSTNLTFVDVVNGASVYDSSNAGNKISINRKVAINGSEDSSTSNVEEILMFSNTIYYRNSFGNWFSKGSSGWTSVSGDPRLSSGGIKTRSARTIIEGLGFNVGPLGSGSGPTSSQIVTALQYCGARWVRLPYKGGSVIGSGSTTPPGSDMTQLQSALLSAGYTNPNLKVQYYADAQSANATSDLWSATQGPYVLNTLAAIKDGNNNPVLQAIEGPNHMDTATCVTVDTTTTYSNSTNASINSARLGWQQTINSWRNTNASALAGIRIIAPTYTNSTWYKQAGTGGTTTLDSNLNTASYADYGAYQLYMTNTLSASSGTTWAGQGMPCGSGNRGIDTAFDHGLQYMAAGTALTGTPNSSLVQVEADAPISGGSLNGYGTDGKSAAKANLCWFFDFMLLGGKRIFWQQLLADTANNSGAYGWFGTDFSTARPSAICMHNLMNLLSKSKTFGDNTADKAAITPNFNIAGLTVGTASTQSTAGTPTLPSTAGTAVPTNFTSANVVKPGVLVMPKSDGTTMIAIWNEPSVQNSYGQSGTLSPAADPVAVDLGSGWNYNLYDISGSGGAQTMSATASTTAYQSGTAGKLNINLYGLPVILELASAASESAAGTTVTDTSGKIVSSAWETWTLTSGGQVAVNGVTDTTTSSVIELYYKNHLVYQENSGNNWWYKSVSSDTWTSTSDPTATGSTTGVQAFSADSVVDGVGVVTSFQRADYYNYSGLATLLGQSGIRYVRADGQADNSNNFQTTLKSLFTTYGIKFHFTCGIQSSASGTVSNLAQYPAGMIKSIGGQNEPNSSNITAACDWNKALYQACKANSTLANIPVATMGFVTANAESNTAAAYPINSYCDIIDIHDYWGNQNPDKNTSGGNSFPSMWAALTSKISTTKASVYGESGTNSNTPYSASNHSGNGIWCDERTEGIQIVRYYMLRARSNSAQTPSICYRYEFKSEQSTNDLREGNFGIVEQDGTTVKPAYTALKNMISLLKDPGSSFTLGKFDFTLSGSTTNVQTMVMQKRDGSFIVAVWNNSDLFVDSTGQVLSLPAAQSVTITLNSGASAFQHYQTASPNSTGSWSTSTAIPSNRQVAVQANSQVLFVLFVTT